MQSDWKQLYKLTAERTGKSEQVYKDIGNCVFKKLSDTLKRPPTLITKLKGIGTWYLRRQRMKLVVESSFFNYQKEFVEGEYFLSTIAKENRREMYDVFVNRLKDYERYTELRKQVREIRNESQVLLEPSFGKDKS